MQKFRQENTFMTFFKVVTPLGCILSLFVVLYIHFRIISDMKALSNMLALLQRELQRFNVQLVLLHLGGLNQPVFGIRLEFWRDGTLNCNCLILLLRIVIRGVYAVLRLELHNHGPFINHEPTLNRY